MTKYRVKGGFTMKRKTKIQWLGFLFGMTVAFGTVPAASAEETVYTAATQEALFAAVEEVNSGAADYAVIRLADDIQVTKSMTITAGTVTIIGEGHTVSLQNGSIGLTGNAVLNLGRPDSRETLDITSTDPTSCVLHLSDATTLNMYDGTVIRDSEARAQAGGVQAVDDSRFHMYGGEIRNCWNDFSVSGGVLVDDSAVFTMYDGIIRDCRGVQGGAVCLGGGAAIGGGQGSGSEFIMHGGTIKNCTDNYLGGGAVCVYTPDKVKLLIDGGSITGCSGAGSGYGGAVFLYSTNENSSVRINSGVFTQNSATYGGFLFVYAGKAEIGNGAGIYGNTAEAAGDDIYNNGDGAVVTIGNVPAGLTLEDCGHGIDGWYDDGAEARWACTRDTPEEETYTVKLPVGEFTDEVGIKAAHGKAVRIRFDSRGGDTPVTEMFAGPDGRLAELPVPTRGGYTFAGWYTMAEDGEEVTAATVFREDTTLYAHWIKAAEPVPDPVEKPTPDSPQTGSSGYAVVWAVLFCTAAAGFLFLKPERTKKI